MRITDAKVMIESALEDIFPKSTPMDTVYSAAQYSLNAGGKRLRPYLVLAFCELFDGNAKKALPFALAMEMIHTYSLIHDDLPAMDNDDFRRGKPTNHKVYGEAMAILAGDGLLNYAFETAIKAELPPDILLRALRVLAESSGMNGMIAGQCIDIETEQKEKLLTFDELLYMHSKKTGAIIEASCMLGAIIAGASEEDINKAKQYGENFGVAFQITDDILDEVGDFEDVGKTLHKDRENNKTTFVTLYGIDESKRHAQFYVDTACRAIDGLDNTDLVKLAKRLIDREK